MNQLPEDLVAVLRKLRPPPALKASIIDGTSLKCVCDKYVPLSNLEIFDSGVAKIVSNVCKGCREATKQDRETARVVCVSCRQVVMRIEPHQDKSGFKFLANHTYHLEECPSCNPDIQKSIILEKKLHLDSNK